MKTIPFLTLTTLTAVMTAAAAVPLHAAPVKTLYVSPTGNDAASGASLPTALRTVAAAQQAARVYHAAHPGAPVAVHLRAGTYFLPAPLHFDGRDSHTDYVGDGVAVISGGTRIGGWKKTGANRWQTTLPAVKAGQWYFEQLYVGAARRYRPRLPKQGYYQIAGALPAVEKPDAAGNAGKGFDRFRFAPGDIHADWYDLPHVQVLPFHIWEMSRFPIDTVDAATNTVAFVGRTPGDQYFTDLALGKRYLVENVREALTEAGEWYLDAATGGLTYLARPGEDPNRTPVVAPRLKSLLEVEGARELHFAHLDFAHTAYATPKAGHSTWQAESDIPAAITVTRAAGVRFERCAVTHTGGYGLWFRTGAKDCAVARSVIADLGAGGIKIGEMDAAKTDADTTTGIAIMNNRIVGGGRIHPAAIGVWIGQAPRNRVENNEIGDFYYTGVSVGWHWGYGTDAARENVVRGNYIHDIGQRVLSDMGGVYTLGGSDGTRVERNYIDNVFAFDYGGWGIYFDEGSSDNIAQQNHVLHVKSSAFHQHYGKANQVLHNFFAGGADGVLARTRPEEHLSFRAEGNFLIARENAPLLGGNWSGTQANYLLDNNIYLAANPAPFPGNRSFADWKRETGQDAASIFQPISAKGDASFGFKAEQMQGIPLRATDAGPGKGSLTDLPPPTITPAFSGFVPPPLTAIREGWEEQTAGTAPQSPTLTVNREANIPAATVLVTDTTAAKGKRSLQIVDAPGQQFSYSPHLYWQPHWETGVVTARVALRWETGATVVHEWRAYAPGGGSYKVGPTFTVSPQGALTANGKALLDLPAGRWVTLEVRCPVGTKATGTYDLVVRLPGRTAPQSFPALPCQDGRAFDRLDWWGWIANGTDTATFYLDDIDLSVSKAAAP